jgi:hypothetical protein
MIKLKTSSKLVVAAITIAASSILAGNVYADEKASMQASRDFAKLSRAGNQAFVELTLARYALFDGKTKAATKLIDEAKAAMGAAGKDKTAFTKAEADLVPPPNSPVPRSADKTMVTWLPISADVVITDDFSKEPAKNAAIAAANASLKKGDRDAAIKTLKLAQVNVAYAVNVVPFDKTGERLDRASALMKAERYYEAGQILREIQHSRREDWIEIDESVNPAQKK